MSSISASTDALVELQGSLSLGFLPGRMLDVMDLPSAFSAACSSLLNANALCLVLPGVAFYEKFHILLGGASGVVL
ncbi:Orotidine 5'-phosphate decarboxylase [Frankliniella fusca]|uniref:Orotidine 5'-phosphate decarboxylase n=1 Tax=Frankliniella fusca TaxID=407009 RepID=A0AAE1HAY3_9NEOP|nr:Orotidine 5'-phosphate decarboxylase [Frankliniella fusca]